MSAALLRQALEFVDPDESKGNRKRLVGSRSHSSSGQGSKLQKRTNKISKQKKTDKERSEEVITKLLKLSTPAVDKRIAGKIVERAATRKPLPAEIKLNTTEEQKSILFPEEDSEQSEKELRS